MLVKVKDAMKTQAPSTRPVHTLPYAKLYRHISAAQHARRFLIGAGIATIMLFIFTLSYNVQAGWMYAVSVALTAALLSLGLAVGIFFASHSLGYGPSEDHLIATALDFLRTANYDDAIVETIKARAEIGATVSPVRSLLPLLLIPLIVSLLNSFGAMPVMSWFAIALFLEALVFPIASDMYTAHIDGVMRHAIAEHVCERMVHPRYSDKDKDQLLLHALLTSDRNRWNSTETRVGWEVLSR